jgi:hypothetical protein
MKTTKRGRNSILGDMFSLDKEEKVRLLDEKVYRLNTSYQPSLLLQRLAAVWQLSVKILPFTS